MDEDVKLLVLDALRKAHDAPVIAPANQIPRIV